MKEVPLLRSCRDRKEAELLQSSPTDFSNERSLAGGSSQYEERENGANDRASENSSVPQAQKRTEKDFKEVTVKLRNRPGEVFVRLGYIQEQ